MHTYGLGIVIAVSALIPKIVSAQEKGVSFNVFVDMLIDGLNSAVVPLIFAFAFLFFLYGVFKYFILGGGSDTSRKEGHMFMLWGIVALAVMLSTWGLVRVFMNTFGL